MIRIKEATINDIPLLRDIGIQTYTEHFSTIWSPAGMQTFLDKDFAIQALRQTLESPDRHGWFLAFDEHDSAVGFAKVNWAKAMPGSDETGAELQKIYFVQSQAGKGYGKHLLQFIWQLAQNRQERLLWLEVLKTNISAQRFYERRGFEVRAEIPFSTDIAAIPMVLMACSLAPA